MRSFPAGVTGHLAAREGVAPRLMAWFRARDRQTGQTETLGLWQGDDHRAWTVQVGASQFETRLYYGAGNLLSSSPLQSEATLSVQQQRLSFSALTPEVEQLVRGYDARFQPVDLHLVHLSPGTDAAVASPVRWWRGYVDRVSLDTPAAGGEGGVEIVLVSDARRLTQRLHRRRSDRSLRDRAPNDDFRAFADVSGSVTTYWGELAPGQAPPNARRRRVASARGGQDTQGGFRPGGDP